MGIIIDYDGFEDRYGDQKFFEDDYDPYYDDPYYDDPTAGTEEDRW